MINNHGRVGKALYLKFTLDNFNKQFGERQQIKDGEVLSIETLNKIYNVDSSVPVHIDNNTQGDYECVCEFGTEIH